jgi:transposase
MRGIEPHLLGRKGTWRGNAKNNRQFINTVFWILRTGSPSDYGSWKDTHRMRHIVENAFLKLKRWCGIATRYVKNTTSFLDAVHIHCIAIWRKSIDDSM